MDPQEESVDHMGRREAERKDLEAFQLTRVGDDALDLMERAALFERARLSTPEHHASVARGAARLARIWAWVAARRSGDGAAATRALRGAEAGMLDSAAGLRNSSGLSEEINALADRALRLEALYAQQKTPSRAAIGLLQPTTL